MSSSVSSRLLSVLGCFDGEHRALTLSDLARHSGLPLSTTHRLVGELVGWGALARRGDGAYVVGRRLWDLGLLAPVQSQLRQVAAPHLHDLHAATQETVHLAVRDGTRALYVDRVSGHRSVPVISRVGGRLPLHTTGVGKVLLAHAPDDVVARVLADLARHTDRSITDPARLGVELAAVRRRGWARTDGEMTLGAHSVAVAVHGTDRQVLAAVGVVVPQLGADVRPLVAALRVVAAGIERSLVPS